MEFIRVCHIFPVVEESARDTLLREQEWALLSKAHAAEQAKSAGILVEKVAVSSVLGNRAPLILPEATHLVQKAVASDLDPSFPPLPLLGPLIETAMEFVSTKAPPQLVVFSNADIGLFPNAYSRIWQLSQFGKAAGSITRRTLPEPLIYAHSLKDILMREGKPHKGSDFFFFPANLLRKLSFLNLSLGVPPIGQIFAFQLFLRNSLFSEFRGERVTFHIGNEAIWRRRSELSPIRQKNFEEATLVLRELRDSFPRDSWEKFAKKVSKEHLASASWTSPFQS